MHPSTTTYNGNPTLYITDLSPFGARLRLVSAFTGQSFSEVPPPGGAGSDSMKAISHFGRMPAIETGDQVLIESIPLMEYLVERAGGSKIVPSDIEQRAAMRGIMIAHDNYVLGAIWPMFLTLRSGKPDSGIVTSALGAATDQYQVLTRLFSPESNFAVGTGVSLADLAMVPFALLFGAIYPKFGVPDPFVEQPRLERWKETAMAIPEVSKVMTVMQAAITKAFG